MEAINDFFKLVFEQQPIMVVLVIIIMFLFLVIYATRSVSKQNTEDHIEKDKLLNLVERTSEGFILLKDAIISLTVSQDKRNESITEQINEQKKTNQNLSGLNHAFADYHTSLADTISNLFKTQVVGRLDKIENRNDEIMDKLNDLGTDIDKMRVILEERS